MKSFYVSLLLILPFFVYSQTGVYYNEENLRSDSINVLNYEIHLDASDFSNRMIVANTVIKFVPKMANLQNLPLDLFKFQIDSITLNNQNLTYSYNDTLLNVNLGMGFNPSDTLSVNVFYHGVGKKDPSGWGGIYFGSNYVFNLGVGFEDNPHNIGRYWFPCFDNFKERSTYNVFLTTPDTHYGTSMGSLVSTTPLPNNKTEWHWRVNESIPTYLAMFAINTYSIVHDFYAGLNRNIPIELYVKPSDSTNLKASFANLKNCMNAFEGLYGEYQFNKIGYTVVNFSSGAMEHASNITYPNNTVDGTLNSETLMAHELAHQWWGNYATTLTPQDMWLNEGMASFSANYFLEHVYGWETAKPEVKSILFNILKKAHINEGGYLAISGVPHELTYGDHVYRKGALVAQNLRMLLGEDNFGTAVTGFLNSRSFNNMTSLQFRDYLSTKTTEDVNGFFNGWVFNGGFPDYKIDSIEVTPTTANYDVKLVINQKLNHAPNQFTSTPIEIVIYDDNFNSETKTIEVGPNESSVEISSVLNPSFISLNGNNKLCYATTDDQFMIKSTGQKNYDNAMWRLDVKSITDSALVKIEHHWSAPDARLDWNTQPYLLSNYRFWKVDGIWGPDFEAEADFLYDGRESGGYLDSLLVNVTEDSLVLLYRSSAYVNWTEYPYYTKNTLGSSTNGFGRILLSKVLKGEYTLANIDHSVLSTGKLKKQHQSIKVYPNPTQGKVTIEWGKNETPISVDIYTLNGKSVLSFSDVPNQALSFNSKRLKSGQYVARIRFKETESSSTFTVL
ncbi:MAG: M1 family aminopeptidase [Salibacteraceae bacterium]